MDKAVSTLEETFPPSLFEKLPPTLAGAKFEIQLRNDSHDKLLPDATIIWDKTHRIETSYASRFLEWLCSNILGVLGLDASIRGCTEHKRRTPNGDKFIFRAHPSWRGGRSWHDWALFSWTNTDGTSVRIPGQIITFVEFDEVDIRHIQHLPYVSGDTPGLYAMIETLERPLEVAKAHQRVVVEGRKQLTTIEMQDRRRHGMPKTSPNLCLVPVDTIYGPIAALPDVGGSPGDFLFIRPVENWGLGFTQLIEDNETAELAQLEGFSDTSSESDLEGDLHSIGKTSERTAIDSVNESSDSSSSREILTIGGCKNCR